jgi:hypothetical protein
VLYELVPEGAFDPLPRWMEFLLRCAVSKYLGHFPEGLIEFHILIDTLDCPALGHPATVRAAAGTVTLTTANDVLLDAVQREKKIFGSISITSWVKEHGGTDRSFREVFSAISRRAGGQSQLFGGGKARQPIGNNAVPRKALLSRISCTYNPGFVSLTRW